MNRVLLIGEHPVMLIGIERVLADAGDFEVLGCCGCDAEALALAARSQPDVIVLDMSPGDVGRHELCRRLIGAAPLCSVMVLTVATDGDAVRQCLDNGAAGALLKTTESPDLVRAVRLVAGGELVVDSALGERLQLIDLRTSASGPAAIQLRPRETEVLRLIATGADTESIAAELGLTVNTVRTYIQNMMEKMGVHSRVQAVVSAQRRGLV